MKRLVASLVVTCGVTAGSAEAQTDANHELFALIYSKIVDSISLKRSIVDPSDNRYFFVVTQPGIFIDPKLLNADGTENDDQKRIFSEVVDRIMDSSWVYVPTDMTYHEYFGTIIQNYQYKSLDLSASEKKELDEADKKLYIGVDENGDQKQTPLYLSYIKRQKAYWTEQEAAQAWLNKHPGASKYPDSVAGSLKNAMDAWIAAGKKRDVEGYLETLYHNAPSGYWPDVRYQYKTTPATGSLHSYYPAVSTWLDDKLKWPSITIGWSKTESHTYNHQTSASGSANFSAGGFFNFGGGASYDRVKNTNQNEATKLEIKFEYMRVDFRRPWLSRLPFSDQRWRFKCGSEPEISKSIVSSGPQPDAGGKVVYPNGKMPLIPTGFLIARNASVTGDFSQDFKEYYSQVTSGSTSSGFGPFSVRGTYNDKTDKTDINATTAKNGFTIGNPQIIGFFAEVLPKSPNTMAGLFEPCSGN